MKSAVIPPTVYTNLANERRKVARLRDAIADLIGHVALTDDAARAAFRGGRDDRRGEHSCSPPSRS
jgi:hypothetical protein